ncbi:putative PHD finger protein 10-like [Apostichopus japonicus]|uniref:PHD finger protein 10 n=1 Tax=Stichopus japonicus TaxID=307972 RepID=A0A2G8JI59_STIJA|nr:putative PHD finger protein 10-like [Apostichopus japonicus]
MQSVLPTPPRETPMISLQPAPMVSLAPPPPVTQVLSQLLQQKAIIPPKHIQYVPKDIPDAICGLCLKDRDCNRKGEPEELVHCSQCDNSGHPSCLEMSAALVCAIKTYPWQCMECKTCTLCGDPTHEDKMMFCDECDRGYHTFCVGLTELPTGLWACASCRCVPPARPLPPPPIEVMPAPLNGTPEAVTPALRASLDPDTPTNGLKRPAEPLPIGEEKEETVMTEIKTERAQAPTPPRPRRDIQRNIRQLLLRVDVKIEFISNLHPVGEGRDQNDLYPSERISNDLTRPPAKKRNTKKKPATDAVMKSSCEDILNW